MFLCYSKITWFTHHTYSFLCGVQCYIICQLPCRLYNNIMCISYSSHMFFKKNKTKYNDKNSPLHILIPLGYIEKTKDLFGAMTGIGQTVVLKVNGSRLPCDCVTFWLQPEFRTGKPSVRIVKLREKNNFCPEQLFVYLPKGATRRLQFMENERIYIILYRMLRREHSVPCTDQSQKYITLNIPFRFIAYVYKNNCSVNFKGIYSFVQNYIEKS